MSDGRVTSDSEAVRRVLDAYASSWFDRDVERARTVHHPDFVERLVAHPGEGMALEEVSLDDVIEAVSEGAPPDAPRRWEADVFRIDGVVASGRVSVGPWEVHMHLGRFGDRWLIVNILYLSGATAP